MKYSHHYHKLNKKEYTTIRRYPKGKVGDIIKEVYPNGSHFAKIMKIVRIPLDDLDELFLYYDTGCSEREDSYKLIQSFYKKTIDFENENFYVYYIEKEAKSDE